MAKPIYQPSSIERQGAIEQFLYEFRMFLVAIDACQDHAVQKNLALNNVVLESALIHARNLLDFFCGKESPKDNVIAGHYVRNPDGTPWTSSRLTFLSSCKADINKALSHLTYSRVKSKPTWQLTQIRQEIKDAYAEFTALLPGNERLKWMPNEDNPAS